MNKRLTQDCYIAERIEPLSEPVSMEYPGEIIVRAASDTGWQTIVIKADPIAQFSDSTLIDAVNGELTWPAEILSLEPPEQPHACPIDRSCTWPSSCFIGWKITVIGANQSFVYIIKTYDCARHSWIGVWPD